MVRRRFSRPRRKLVWARVTATGAAPFAIPPATANPTRFDGLLNFEQSLGASTVGVTVKRIRGYFCAFDTSRTLGNIEQLRFTAYVGDNNDINRGVNVNDSSFDQLSENRDFFLYEPFLIAPVASGTTVSTSEAPHELIGRRIDNRSSRKIEELNETLIFDVSAFSPNAAVADTVGFTFDLSILLALP